VAESKVPGVEADPDGYSVSAYCSTCRTITSFDPRPQPIILEGSFSVDRTPYSRELFFLLACARCGRGAVGNFVDQGNSYKALLLDFAPHAVRHTDFKFDMPEDISSEFQEAERCAAFGANRAAAALCRSTLEKVLKANGYRKEVDPKVNNLLKGIDAACDDNIISEARRKRAHEDIRLLGNDVLHDDWREVTNDEVERAHRYTQRILEDFYDDRETVVKALQEKQRLPEQTAADTKPER
jgi:Domain of unknown function (DUF4145)